MSIGIGSCDFILISVCVRAIYTDAKRSPNLTSGIQRRRQGSFAAITRNRLVIDSTGGSKSPSISESRWNADYLTRDLICNSVPLRRYAAICILRRIHSALIVGYDRSCIAYQSRNRRGQAPFFSPALPRRANSSFAKIRQDHRLSVRRHKSNGFIAHRKLSSSPAAAAPYEVGDHVEDPRVRNANCNYGQGVCARHFTFSFSLLLSLSFFLSFSPPLSHLLALRSLPLPRSLPSSLPSVHQRKKVTAARMNAHL